MCFVVLKPNIPIIATPIELDIEYSNKDLESSTDMSI